MLSSSYSTFTPSTRYDEKGRQLQFVETDSQRRERIEFLKMFKSEWMAQDPFPPHEYAIGASPKYDYVGLHHPSSDHLHFGTDMGRESETHLIYSSHIMNSPPPVSFAPMPPSPRDRRRQRSWLSSIPEES